MTWSKPALPLVLTSRWRIAWSAPGWPVNRPVLIDLSLAMVAVRACAAASQAASSVSESAHLQPALGVLALAGITNEVPVATVTGWPSLPLNGTPAMLIRSLNGDSTLGYHW